jgi:lysophospholipase L1-like esterase
MKNWQTNLAISSAVCALLPILAAPPAWAQSKPVHWVGTWGAAAISTDNAKGPLGTAEFTVRNIVHTSIPGDVFRIVVTNELGTKALTVGAADVALSAGGSAIRLESSRVLTFGGAASVTIPPGAKVFSDPVAMPLVAGSDVAVSLFIPKQPIPLITQHSYANSSNFIVPGNVAAAATLTAPVETDSWDFLGAIEVEGPGASVVTLGDSITDGASSTRGANLRWPDDLARRLLADKKTARTGVLNEGIGGNRILHDTAGPSALARFDRDVLSQAGVKYLILLEGVNDIGVGTRPANPTETVSAADLIFGMSQLIERSHTHGIKVYVGTIMPYRGLAMYYTPAGEAERQAVNDWIRTSKLADGVIDFAKAVEDPADPERIRHEFDHDGIHPNDAGHQAMADAIDLSWFTR